MPRPTIPFRAGSYGNCGVLLHVLKRESSNVLAVEQMDGTSLTWTFSAEGVFTQIGAHSAPVVASELPASLLACPHIHEDFEGTVIRSSSPGQSLGWICCTECIEGMLVGRDAHDEVNEEFVTHVVAQGLTEKLTEKCAVLETVLLEKESQ